MDNGTPGVLFKNTAHIVVRYARLSRKDVQLVAGTVVVGDVAQDLPGMVDGGIVEGDGIVLAEIIAENQPRNF